jgi:hypothetical protein
MYNPSIPDTVIDDEEKVIGIKFPSGLRQVLKIMNGIEYLNEWTLYSVLNPKNPKAKYGYFRIESVVDDRDYMPKGLFKIAADGSGNHLVLKVVDGMAGNEIFRWDHETNQVARSSVTFEKLAKYALIKIDLINKKILKSKKGAQQVDSAEASTIAVPPSNLPGSPR